MGSEFLRDGTRPGELNAVGVRHEDVTRLTFPDMSFDHIGTFDVLEHVPDYRLALKNLFRCLRPGGMLHELARATGKRIVFYCAFGERSAMAVQAAQEAALATACHIHGGLEAWRKAGGPLLR